MLFITCKKIENAENLTEGMIKANIASPLKQFVKDSDSPDNQVYFCKYLISTVGNAPIFKEIGSIEFMSQIKDDICDEVLFYLHGFNNQPNDVLYQTEILQRIINDKSTKRYLVIPVIWPCHDQVGILRDYWDDQKSADLSGFAIARALAMFVQWQRQNQINKLPCTKIMNVLSHSMGNRVLKEAIYNWGHYDSFSKVPSIFRNIFMAAADVTHQVLENAQKGSFIPYAAKNVVVYYAGDDRALQGSKLVNIENRQITKRLGHGGPTSGSFVHGNVYSVDCDAINSKYDILGHTYFVDAMSIEKLNPSEIKAIHGGKMFEHMKACLDTGKVTTGTQYAIKEKEKKRFWGLF